MKANGELVAGLLAHLILLGAPGVAAALYAVKRGVRNVPAILAIALVASGATAYAAFWAYYGASGLGQAYDFLLFLASAAAIAWCWRSGDLDRSTLRELRAPLLLWILGSCFVVFLGFLHGGVDNAVTMSSFRFSGQLPSDNDIPRYFAEWFSTHGHSQPLPVYPGEWLSSDRPPLQIGYVLAQRGFFNTPQYLHYEILCVIEQGLWIVGMWAVLTAAGLRARTRGLAMLVAMVSDIALVHGFFVWPKLIAAAFVLAAFALVISPAWKQWRDNVGIAALFGALLALAMLSHGSSIFGVIPLVLIAAWRGIPSWRWLGAAVLGGLVLMGPWMAFQHYEAPPGNRLLKWQLAGETGVTPKGTVESIEDAYDRVGLNGALDLKADNLGEIVGWPRLKTEYNGAVANLEADKPGYAMANVRWLRFFSELPFLGFLLIGPLAMLIARLRRQRHEENEWRFALLCFGFYVVACVAWALLEFGTPEARTTIHVGSLAIPLLGAVGCIVGLRSCFPRLAAWVAGFNILFVLALYVPALEPDPGTSYSPLTALLAAASLAGMAFVALRGTSPPPDPAAPTEVPAAPEALAHS
ncbi:MAG: hypothetical protein ABW065_00490 [Solirubrobacterales bacterium]